MSIGNIISIYKINTNAVFLSDCNSINEKIDKIISRANERNSSKRKIKDQEIKDYSLIKIKEIDTHGFNIRLYHAERKRQNSWNLFLSTIAQDDNLRGLQNQDHDFIVFVYNNKNIFCFTGGIGYTLIEDICDENFPKELMIRLSDSEKIKQAKSRGITGSYYAREFYFRGNYSISASEAFGSIWKDIRASIKENIKNDTDWQLIIGNSNEDISCEAKNSFKIRKKFIFADVVKLIEKIEKECERHLTKEESENFYFLDTVKIIKDKTEKEKLIKYLAQNAYEFLIGKKDNFDYDFCHKKYTDFFEAQKYVAKKGRKELFAWERINCAKDILLDIKDEINLSSFDEFFNDFTKKIEIISENTEEKFKTISGSILDHLHGELSVEDITYFLIDKEWYSIKKSFLDVLSSDFSDYIKNNNFLNSSTIPINKWTKDLSEGKFNESHLSKENFYVADRITLNGIEFFDLLYIKNSELYIIQVKDGLGASTRDACSQLRNSSKIIEESIKEKNHSKLKDFYLRLQNTKIKYSKRKDYINSLKKIGSPENFLKLFLESKNRTYVLAYRYDADPIDTQSNIAKFEILGLKNAIKDFNANFKLYKIDE